MISRGQSDRRDANWEGCGVGDLRLGISKCCFSYLADCALLRDDAKT
jgi:hypothetical protein